jgi:DNA-binding XRE family transcriptional regulator
MADLSDEAARRAEAQERWRQALREEHRRLVGELKRRRTELGLTQEQVGARIGVSRSQIANAESGTYLLSVETLIGYAAAVGARLTMETSAD